MPRDGFVSAIDYLQEARLAVVVVCGAARSEARTRAAPERSEGLDPLEANSASHDGPRE